VRDRGLNRIVGSIASLALAACSTSGLDVMPEPKLLDEARTSLAGSNFDRAVDCSEALIERTSDSARKQEALYIGGEAHFYAEEWVKAFGHYQTLLHDYPYSQYVPKIEEHVYAIGVEYLSREPWFFFHDLFSGRERGAEVMREFAASYPNSSKADDALAAVANYRFGRREYEDAVVFYQRLARNYPDSEWADLAAFRRAECWRLDTRGGGYEERALLRAAAEYRRYLGERPHGSFVKQAQEEMAWVDEQIAISEIKIAQLYLLRDQPTGAQIHFANVALAYPRTTSADEARRELQKHGWDLSRNSLDTLKLSASETGDWVGDRLRGDKGYE
jgi:outer membrane protein assembly factor BamD (BamD/ComL family)